MDPIALPPTWLSKFELFISWAKGDERVKRAHIKAPRGSGKSTQMPINVWDNEYSRSKEMGSQILYVTNHLERENISRIFEMTLTNDGGDRLLMYDYGGLLDILRANMEPDTGGHTEQRWRRWKVPADCTVDSLLPPRVMIMIDSDPGCGADFALSMILLRRWAQHRASVSGARVRIVTMSCGADTLKYFWSSVDHGLVCHLELPAAGSRNPLGDADLESFTKSSHVSVVAYKPIESAAEHELGPVHQVKRTCQRHRFTKHNIVVCREDSLVSPLIKNQMQGPRIWINVYRLTAESTYAEWREAFFGGPITDDDDRAHPTLDVVIVPRGRFPNLPFPGGSHVHLIVDDPYRSSYANEKLGLVTVDEPLDLPGEELLDLLAWVAPRRGQYLATVYLPESRIEGYSDGSVAGGVRRSHVSYATQKLLGGFLCALTEYAKGDDSCTADAAGLFNTLQCVDGLSSLMLQGVIDKGPLRLAGPLHDQRELFYRLLPVVQYDYRLAVLLSLPTRDTIVGRIKAQLAAMLMIGCDQLFDLSRLPEDGYTGAQYRAEGYTSSLTMEGTWWVLLGILKPALRVVKDNPEAAEDVSVGVPLSGGRKDVAIKVSRSAMVHFSQALIRIMDVMHKCDITDVVYPPESEPLKMELSQESRDELYGHLLHAFVSGLVVYSKEMVLVSSNVRVATMGYLEHLIDLDDMLEGQDLAFGVTDRLLVEREAGKPQFGVGNMVGIPHHIVRKWEQVHHSGESVFRILERRRG